eukprot:198235-Chlamydomonas_euryale.AAC.1
MRRCGKTPGCAGVGRRLEAWMGTRCPGASPEVSWVAVSGLTTHLPALRHSSVNCPPPPRPAALHLHPWRASSTHDQECQNDAFVYRRHALTAGA